ncbi:2-dehydropantoate 2-reductase [Bowmanella denitrificans]|uniref:2-dehydropantoate 2-reductase n=1 Tax=Bowmanella denitrificans TaxID=366582 RepID=A0ABN0XKJ8_9ALTE
MKVVILGQGAIGSLLAARCQWSGVDYAVIGRDTKLQAIHFQSIDGRLDTFTPPSISQEQLRGSELLILPLKAYQILPALKSLKPSLSSQPLILLHNGLGTEHECRALLPAHPVALAITRLAALKQGIRVQETGRGQTDLSWVQKPDSDTMMQVQQLITNLLPPSEWHRDLRPLQWAKLAINAVINPLTALHNIRNGELASAEFQVQIQALNQETAKLMQNLGIPGSDDLNNKVAEVINATAANFSSMHQDFTHGRQTEVDYINGFLVRSAAQRGMSLPQHQALWQAIKHGRPAN